MIRIRFHGRGGHGVKTASRIVGTAAFRAGYQCQDSPVYGAERRGAAVTAFTRFDDQPIRERGVIALPDLIVVADETLLRDPTAAVLAGSDAASVLFVNTDQPDRLELPPPLRERLVTFDLTRRTLAVLGRAAALSAGLGAVAARLTGQISEKHLIAALRDELSSLNVAPAEIAQNEQIAHEVFAALAVANFSARSGRETTANSSTAAATGAPSQSVAPAQSDAAAASNASAASGAHPAFEAAAPSDSPPVRPLEGDRVIRFPSLDAIQGAPSVLAGGNSAQRMTGAWRLERPVIDRSACTRCGLCFVMCPDGAVSLDADGYPVIDYDHCKGCMICRQLCPVEAVAKERETRAW